MRIRLEKASGFICLALPEATAGAMGLSAGQEVDVFWDSKAEEMVIRPVKTEAVPVLRAPSGEDDVLRTVEAFISRHSKALEELARL
jgi:hypothetical protein